MAFYEFNDSQLVFEMKHVLEKFLSWLPTPRSGQYQAGIHLTVPAYSLSLLSITPKTILPVTTS